MFRRNASDAGNPAQNNFGGLIDEVCGNGRVHRPLQHELYLRNQVLDTGEGRGATSWGSDLLGDPDPTRSKGQHKTTKRWGANPTVQWILRLDVEMED